MRKRTAALIGTILMSAMMAMNAFAEQPQNHTDPLDLSHLKKWIVMEPYVNPNVFWGGDIDTRLTPQWINCSAYSMNHPELPSGFCMDKAIEEHDIRYICEPSTGGETTQLALAEMAGFPRSVRLVYPEKVDKLKAAIADFLNHFPNWKTASDYEKAVRICEWIGSRAVYDTSDEDCFAPYGALVNGRACCSGLTSAAVLLGWAVDLPVAEDSPRGAAHVFPVFYINGVWLSVELTHLTHLSFRVHNVYKLNGNEVLLQGDDLIEFANLTGCSVDEVGLSALGYYCKKVGYQIPSNKEVRAAFPGNWTYGVQNGEETTVVLFPKEFRMD